MCPPRVGAGATEVQPSSVLAAGFLGDLLPYFIQPVRCHTPALPAAATRQPAGGGYHRRWKGICHSVHKVVSQW
jgi:hypothetical protein